MAIQEAYGDYCHVINIHAGSLATPYPGQTDLRSAYGEALATQAGVTGIPSVSVNRHLFSSAQTAWAMTGPDTWFDYVDEVAGMETYVTVGAEATIDWQSRELDVTVQLYYTGDAPEEGNRIHVAVVQDNVEGYQIGSEANPDQVLENGNYLHQHVLRDLLTGLEGDLVETVAAGKTLISQSIGRTIPLVEMYRTLKNKNKEVLVRIAYNAEMAKEAAKNALRGELEKKSEDLHKKLEQILSGK